MTAIKDFLIGLLAVVVPGLGGPSGPVYNGYLEADFVYVAPSGPGRIASIDVAEGDSVTEGQPLAAQEDGAQQEALRAAEAAVAQARAELDNLQTGGRTAELAVIRAALDKARADRTLAQSTLDRSAALLAHGRVPPAEVDADRAALSRAAAEVERLQAELQVAELPARDARRRAAQAALDMAEAQAAIARVNLADRRIAAPVAGRVERVYFEAGEVAATGAPLLSILPPGPLKAIVFIPEADRAGIHRGDRLALDCDGCAGGLSARITHLASDPQYTPPIIYSRDERARLVFRAEARLDASGDLLPGQPITLRPQP